MVAVIGVVGLLYARSTLRPIRENVAAQKRFIADASHELRTPLTVMKSEFEVALRHAPPASELRPAMESGLQEVDRMTEMVEDLLTLSRIDAHQEQLVLERMDLDRPRGGDDGQVPGACRSGGGGTDVRGRW